MKIRLFSIFLILSLFQTNPLIPAAAGRPPLARVVPLSFDNKTQQWNVLLGQNKSDQFWSDFGKQYTAGNEGTEAANALASQTKNLIDFQDTIFIHQATNPQTGDIFYFVKASYIPGKTLYTQGQSAIKGDFAWLPAETITQLEIGKDVPGKKNPISGGFHKFFKATWSDKSFQAALQTVQQQPTPGTGAGQPTTPSGAGQPLVPGSSGVAPAHLPQQVSSTTIPSGNDSWFPLTQLAVNFYNPFISDDIAKDSAQVNDPRYPQYAGQQDPNYLFSNTNDGFPVFGWPTAEHFFHAQKILLYAEQFKVKQPQTKQALGEIQSTRASQLQRQMPKLLAQLGIDLSQTNWHSKDKYEVMGRALREKFKTGTPAAQYLINQTNNRIIIEHAVFDGAWGIATRDIIGYFPVTAGKGANHLGRMLMLRRKELQDDQTYQYDPQKTLTLNHLAQYNYNPAAALNALYGPGAGAVPTPAPPPAGAPDVSQLTQQLKQLQQELQQLVETLTA